MVVVEIRVSWERILVDLDVCDNMPHNWRVCEFVFVCQREISTCQWRKWTGIPIASLKDATSFSHFLSNGTLCLTSGWNSNSGNS